MRTTLAEGGPLIKDHILQTVLIICIIIMLKRKDLVFRLYCTINFIMVALTNNFNKAKLYTLSKHSPSKGAIYEYTRPVCIRELHVKSRHRNERIARVRLKQMDGQ